MTPRRVLPAFVVLILAVACGGSSPHVRRSTLESQLVGIEQAKKLPYPVGAASCPGDIADRVGTLTTCTVALGGVAVPIDLEVVGTTGGAQISATISVPVLTLDDAQRALVRRSNALTGASDATADCETGNGGKPLLVSTIGATFDCRVTTAGAVHTVTLKVNDVAGSVAIVAQDDVSLGSADPTTGASAAPSAGPAG